MDVLHAETSILFLCKVVTLATFTVLRSFLNGLMGKEDFFFISKTRIIDFEDTLRGASDLFN